MAVNYNDGHWHGWNGGECPVHPETVVEAQWINRGNLRKQTEKANEFIWGNHEYQTVAFRVIKEHRDPRVFWVDHCNMTVAKQLHPRPRGYQMKAELVDYMGDDLSVVNAARVSFDKVSEWDGMPYGPKHLSDADTRLINYLARNNHWTPFAHTSISLRMSAPVPIRTQCFKHKQGFVENEESRRYISSRPDVFMPDVLRSAPVGNVKQGSGETHYDSTEWLLVYKRKTKDAVDTYMEMIQDGVCPEQARFILPQGCIVNWIWTGNLASYARFYKERTYDKAQKEVQELARMVADIIKPLYPVSWAALVGG